MSDSTPRSYQTRIKSDCDDPFTAYAELMAHIEHSLFKEISKGNKSSDFKSSYLKEFEITARQFNAVRIRLEGKVDSVRKVQLLHIETKKNQIANLEKIIQELEKKRKNKLKLHLKKRRLNKLKTQLQRLETAVENNDIPLCFGSKKLFRSQFNLLANGYNNHEEWKSIWRQARASDIFIVGSKDETSGNQSCIATIDKDGSISLKVRMPDALIPQFGKYQFIHNVRFAYGHDVITAAIRDCQLRQQLYNLGDPSYKNHGQALTFLFKKDLKSWRIFITTDFQLPKIITNEANGVIGVDINSDHLAVVETDRFGNPINSFNIPLRLYDLSHNQIKALVGDASAQIIALCETTKKPLILEDLDFSEKKDQLREENASYARMLSGFAYSTIITQLKSRGQSRGVAVHTVNPAYTSIIGQVKFASRYGLTIHLAAALCIGRRFLRLSEKLPQGQRDIPDGKGGHVTLDLPVRNRSRHVWSQWRQVKKKVFSGANSAFSGGSNRSSSPPKGGSCDSNAFGSCR